MHLCLVLFWCKSHHGSHDKNGSNAQFCVFRAADMQLCILCLRLWDSTEGELVLKDSSCMKLCGVFSYCYWSTFWNYCCSRQGTEVKGGEGKSNSFQCHILNCKPYKQFPELERLHMQATEDAKGNKVSVVDPLLISLWTKQNKKT